MANRSNPQSVARRWRFGGPGLPPVRLDQIRGETFVTLDLAWPALAWGSGRCWAYLHDLDSRALAKVMESLREAELERSVPHGALAW